MNIFERIAEIMEEDRLEAFNGNPPSTKYLQLSESTDTKVIGRHFPQTDHIDLKIAHSLSFHNLSKTPVNFKRIELHKTARVTDVLSTAAISAHAFLLSRKALEVFLQFDLGKHEIYPATVYHNGGKYDYGVLHFVNDLHGIVDFTKSEFYLANILGGYERDIEIESRQDYDTKWKLVSQGIYPETQDFWSIKLKHGILDLNMLEGSRQASPDIFTILSSSEEVYTTKALAQAIVDEDLTGFNISKVYALKD